MSRRAERTPRRSSVRGRGQLERSAGVVLRRPVLSPDGGRVVLEGTSSAGTGTSTGTSRGVILADLSGSASFSRDGRLVASPDAYQETAGDWSAEDGALPAELPPQPPRFPGEVTGTTRTPLPKPKPPSRGEGTGISLSREPSRPRVSRPKPVARFSPSGDLVATWVGREEARSLGAVRHEAAGTAPGGIPGSGSFAAAAHRRQR